MNTFISTEEKKQLFDRLLEMETKMDTFLNEAQEMINKGTVITNNNTNRIIELEKKCGTK